MSNRYSGGFITASYNGLKVPDAPIIGTATGGASSVSVTFTAPADVGGGAITGYTATSSPGGFTGTGTSSPITVSGLSAGTSYTLTVVATNAYGPSVSSAASNSASPVVYFIGALGGTDPNTAKSIAVDSNFNVYVFGGHDNGVSSNDFQLAKYDTSGVIQFQKTLSGATSSDKGNDIALDSSGNVYVIGSSDDGPSRNFQIAKYNSSGAVQWQRRLGNTSSNDVGFGISVDSSSNAYVTGVQTYNGGGNICPQIAKYDSSGAIQWQRRLSPASGDDYFYGVAAGSSVYACGFSQAAGNNNLLLVKYDTSGTLQWQKILGGANSEFGYGAAIDSSGNVFVSGQTNVSGNYDMLIAKYDSSGTVIWQRKLGDGAVDSVYGSHSIALDSSDNAYVCWSNGTGNLSIAKYNSSGTIQWQRTLSGACYGWGAAIDTAGTLYISGYLDISPARKFLFAKLPNDGSLTGTYTVAGTSLTYAASSYTDSATTLTEATSTLTAATSTLVDAATTLTEATSTLTSSVTTI